MAESIQLNFTSTWTYNATSDYVTLATITNTKTYTVRIKKVILYLGTGYGTFTDGAYCVGYGNPLKTWISFYKSNGSFVGMFPNDGGGTSASDGMDITASVSPIWYRYDLSYPNPANCAKYEFTYTGAYNVLLAPNETLTIKITGGMFGGYEGTGKGILCIDKYGINGSSRVSYAEVEPQSVTVTFNGNGGTSPTSQSVVPNASITLPASNRNGYTFKGWYTTSSEGTRVGGAGDSYIVKQNITLYAQWNINKYTLEYNRNGGTGTLPPSETNKDYGTIITVAPCDLDRTDYVFSAWNTADDGSGTDYYPGSQIVINDNITLYAKWTPKDISLVYRYNATTHTWNIIDYPPIRKYVASSQQWNDLPAYIYSNGQWIKMGEST